MPTTQLPIPSSTELRTIQKIRDAVQRSTSPLLDRKILDEDPLSKLGDAFQLPIPSHYGNPNVPLKHVFSLGRRNDAWMEGDTWRDVPIKRLHGNGWTDCVFEYFENEIGDKQFDAPGATYILQLTSYGGVTLCRNGNHRLAAAYAWLVATRGDNAELKRVDTELVAIDRRKVEAVLGLLPDGSQTDISICPYPNFWTTQYYPRKPLFKVGSGKTASYYSYTESGMELVWQTPALLHKMLHMVFDGFENRAVATLGEALASNDWLPVPTWLLHAWLSCNWFDDAFNQAAPWTPCAQSHL